VSPSRRTSRGVLLPYQQRWLQDRARVKVCEKSRRIGATWATAAHAVLEASNGKQDVWYVSYSEESGKEFVLDCQKWAKRLNLAAQAMGEIIVPVDDEGDLQGARAFQIVFPSGKRITSLTSSPRSLRGKQGLVIIDEAAFHDRLAEVLKAAFALLMWGGSVWIMSTHNGVDNPFNLLCDEIRDGKRNYSLHRITIDDALSEGLYQRICLVLGETWTEEKERAWLLQLADEYGDGVREELYCEPARGGQSYLGRPLIESCMVDAPVVRLTRDDRWLLDHDQETRTREVLDWCEAVLGPLLRRLPADLPHAMGWDFGRYSDRSVLAPFTLAQNLVRRCPFLVELENVPHHDQWTIMEYVGERLPSLFAAHLDAGGNGNWISEQALSRWGEDVVRQVDITQRWYAETMPAFREAHERGLITYPRDLDVRQDLSLIRRIDGIPKLPKERTESVGGKGHKRHGDAAIALALGYAAACEADAEAGRWDALSAHGEGGGYAAGW
jgi:phage FluMu gp28-like protein